MAVNPPRHDTDHDSRAALEGIPHLTQKICALWGSDELDVFLGRLIMDGRDGIRKGLPIPVAAEIMFLAQANKMIRAIALGKKLNLGLDAAYRRVDEADQARLRIDAMDDPTVSRDTIVSRSRQSAATPTRQTAAVTVGSQAQGLGELLGMLMRSKFLTWTIVVLLGLKFLWPTVKSMI